MMAGRNDIIPSVAFTNRLVEIGIGLVTPMVARHKHSFRGVPNLPQRNLAGAPQIRGLELVDASVAKLDWSRFFNPCHDDARTFGLGYGLAQLHLAVAVYAFHRLHHTAIISQNPYAMCAPWVST